jgi:hypothetical protein
VEPETIGRLIPLIITLVVCVVCTFLAFKAAPRSRRLAGLALACGLFILPALCSLTLARGPNAKATFTAIGAVLVVAGIAAAVLAICSLVARKRDGGTATVAPRAAILLSVMSGMMGIGIMLLPFVTAGGFDAGTPPWTHRVDPPGVELTLPSRAWRIGNASGNREVVRFGCPNPAMVASIMEIRPAATAREFEAAVNDIKRLRARNPGKLLEEKREPNSNGYDHWWFFSEESDSKERIFVAMSVTWWNKTHAVIVIFEGQHVMTSQAAQSQETDTFRSAARTILSSVK